MRRWLLALLLLGLIIAGSYLVRYLTAESRGSTSAEQLVIDYLVATERRDLEAIVRLMRFDQENRAAAVARIDRYRDVVFTELQVRYRPHSEASYITTALISNEDTLIDEVILNRGSNNRWTLTLP